MSDDDDIDRGWFQGEGKRKGEGEVSIVPETRSPEVSGETWERVLGDLQTYQKEIAASVDPRRRAVLCYEVGRIYERELGDHRIAIKFFQQAFRCDPTHLPTLVACRRLFGRAGKWGMVLRLIDAELRVHKSPARRARLLRDKGEIYLSRFQKAEAARASYAQALDLVPGDTLAARGLANAAAVLGDAVAFVEGAVRAAEGCPDPGIARGLRLEAAQAALSSGDSVRATRLLERILDAAPDDSGALRLLARAHRSAGRWRDFLRLEHQAALAEEKPGRRARELAHLATLAIQQTDEEGWAIELLEEAVEADPGAPMALESLVRLHRRAHHWDEAARTLERLVEVSEDPISQVERLWELAELRMERLDQPDAAIAELQRLLGIKPDWLPALELLGRLLIQKGDWEALAAMHEGELQAIEDPRERAYHLLRLGELHERNRKDNERAAEAYAKAVELDPKLEGASRALGRTLVRLERWSDYVAVLLAEADRAGRPAARLDALCRAAEVQATHLEDQEGAVDLWRRALDLEPKALRAIRGMARLCHHTGRFRELVELNGRELELTEDTPARLRLLVSSAEICSGELGEHERAVDFLTEALDLDGGYRPALRALGRACQRGGRWAELVEVYRREIAQAEGRSLVGPYYKVGEILRDKLGNLDEAARSFEAALELEPEHLPSLRALQQLHSAQGDAQREVELRALEVEQLREPREQATRLFRLGRTYADRLKQPELAAAAWERALHIDPEFRQAHAALLDLHEAQGDAQATTAMYRRLAEGHPDPNAAADWYCELGRRSLRVEAPGEAIEALEKAIELVPDHVAALLILERIYLQTGEVGALANTYGALADAVEPGMTRAEWLVQRAHVRDVFLGDVQGALADFQAALKLDPMRAEALEWVARHAVETRAVELLARVLEARLRIADHPRDREVLLMRAGELLQGASRNEEAARCFEAALELSPGSPVALRALRTIYESMGRKADALKLVEREGRNAQDPQVAAALLVEAGRSREEGVRQTREALEDYLAALQRNPEDPEALAAVRRLSNKTGQWAPLVEAIELVVHAKPQRTDLLLEVAELYSDRLGRPAAAARALHQAITEAPRPEPEALQRLADLEAELEHWPEAVRYYERLIARTEDVEMRRAVRFRLASILHEKQGSPEAARSVLEEALKERRYDYDAARRLADVCGDLGDEAGELKALEAGIEAAEPPSRGVPLRQRLAERFAATGRLEQAIEALEAALKVAPQDRALLERTGELCAEAGRPTRLRAVFHRLLAALPPGLAHESLRLRRRLVELTIDAGGQEADVLEELKEAVDAAPSDADLRGLYAETLRSAPKHFDEAIEQYQWLVNRDPFDTNHLKNLRRLSQKRAHKDRAYELARVLNCLKAAGDDETGAIHVWRKHVARWPERAIDASLRSELRSGREPEGLAPILETLSQALPEVFAPPANVTRLPTTTDVTLSASRITRLLGYDDLEVVLGARPTSEVLREGDVVIFGKTIGELSEGERAFVLATGLELANRGLGAVTRWSPTALRGLFESLAKAAGHQVKPRALRPDALEARAAALQPRVAGRSSPALDSALFQLAEILDTLDVGGARAAYIASAHRVALLLCGGVVPAIGALQKGEAALKGSTPPLQRVPGVAGIIRWAAGDLYYAQRKALGVSKARI